MLIVLTVAGVLGGLVGVLLLPDRGREAGGEPRVVDQRPSEVSSGSAVPAASPSPSSRPSATASADSAGPVSSTNMLGVGDLREVGLSLTPRRADVRLELVGCEKKQTLDTIAASGPPLQRAWEAGSVVAYQQAIVARSEEEASGVVRRVLRTLEKCQRRPRGYWLYGPTHTQRLGPGVSVSWLGEVDGSLNTTGHAPQPERINGGVAVLQHGARVAVLSVDWCVSAGDGGACVVAAGDAAGQLNRLSRTAALKLG